MGNMHLLLLELQEPEKVTPLGVVISGAGRDLTFLALVVVSESSDRLSRLIEDCLDDGREKVWPVYLTGSDFVNRVRQRLGLW